MSKILFTNPAMESEVDETIVADQVAHIADNQKDDMVLDRAVQALENLTQLHDAIHERGIATESEVQLVSMVLEQVRADCGLQVQGLNSALESADGQVVHISTESVIGTLIDGIKSLVTWIINRIKNEVDSVQAFFLLFERQSDRIVELKREMGRNPIGKSALTRTRSVKYVRYGDNTMVQDFPEYVKKFSEMAEFMTEYNRRLAQFVDKDALQSWKVLFSPLTGYDDKYEEMFNNLQEFIENSASTKGVKKIHSNDEHTDYDSQTMLGMSHVEMRVPNRKAYREGDIRQMSRLHKYFVCELVRDQKFSFAEAIPGGSYVLDGVTPALVEQLLRHCDELIASYKPYLAIFKKLTGIYGSRWVLVDAAINAMMPYSWWVALLKNYRLMVRTSAILYANMAGAQNFTRGNIAHAIALVANIRRSN